MQLFSWKKEDAEKERVAPFLHARISEKRTLAEQKVKLRQIVGGQTSSRRFLKIFFRPPGDEHKCKLLQAQLGEVGWEATKAIRKMRMRLRSSNAVSS